MRYICMENDCYIVHEVCYPYGGKVYTIKIGKLRYRNKFVFTIDRDGDGRVLLGWAREEDEDWILKTLVGVIERNEWHGNIYHDADGNIRVNKAMLSV